MCPICSDTRRVLIPRMTPTISPDETKRLPVDTDPAKSVAIPATKTMPCPECRVDEYEAFWADGTVKGN